MEPEQEPALYPAPDAAPDAAQSKSSEGALSRMVHDVRTPLATIKISAQLIARGVATPADVARLTAKILSAVDRIDQIVTDVKDADQKSFCNAPVPTADRRG